MKIIITIIVILTLLMAGFCWFVLRSTLKDISDKAPYSEMLHDRMMTRREMVLAKNLPEFKVKEQLYISENTILFEGVKKIAKLPKNTEVKFLKAYEFTGGTSGITRIVLTGDVKINNVLYKIEYQMSIPIDDFTVKTGSKEFLQKSEQVFNELFRRD